MLGGALPDGTRLLGPQIQGQELIAVDLPQRGRLLLRDDGEHAG